MKKRNYYVRIDDIYIGDIAKISNIYKDEFGKTKYDSEYIRSIIFTKNDNMAEDLLYQSPKYLIFNNNAFDYYLLKKDNIIIEEATSLAPLLYKLGCKEYLGYKDILLVMKLIANKNLFLDKKDTLFEKIYLNLFFEGEHDFIPQINEGKIKKLSFI